MTLVKGFIGLDTTVRISSLDGDTFNPLYAMHNIILVWGFEGSHFGSSMGNLLGFWFWERLLKRNDFGA